MGKRFLVPLTALCLLIICLLGSAQGAPQPSEDVHFYFAQMTDTHLGDEESFSRLQKAIASINNLPMPIVCVVHTGDIMFDNIGDADLVRRSLEAFGSLRPPVHFIAGNHDIIASNVAPTQSLYQQAFGPLMARAEYQGVVFLMMYTGPLSQSISIDGYDPLRWLEQSLHGARGKPVIIFHHASSVEDFYGNAMHPGWPLEARGKWEQLIKTHNVKAVIAGHFHRDELHWIGRVPVHICPPVANLFGRESTYRIYEYHNGSLAYRTQYPK